MKKAEGTFSIVSWNESTAREQGEQKATRATVEYSLGGGINGQLFVEYVMFYSEFDPEDVHAGAAEFSGSIWFVGEINGLKGSFGAMDQGKYAAGEVGSNFQIVQDSGRGDLRGIRGKGAYSAGQSGMKFDLNYEL